jgi:hypothetical protein
MADAVLEGKSRMEERMKGQEIEAPSEEPAPAVVAAEGDIA